MERSELRAGDADRRRVTDLLQQHYVDGRLSSDELSERMDRATAARTFGEPEAVLHDLPTLGTAGAPGPDAREVSSEPAGLWASREFRGHATSYALVMGLLVAIWLLTSPGGYFWPIWPMLGWGLGLAFHAMATRQRAAKDRARRRARRPGSTGSGGGPRAP